jgi:hypothetical protein
MFFSTRDRAVTEKELLARPAPIQLEYWAWCQNRANDGTFCIWQSGVHKSRAEAVADAEAHRRQCPGHHPTIFSL